MRQPRVPHVAADRVVQLRLLQMELRVREAMEIADVIVVQVRQNDVLDLVAVDADELQRVDRVAQECALAPLSGFLCEAAVDDERALRPLRDPEEIVHRHRRVVRIAADEMIGAFRFAHRIADREEFIFGKLAHLTLRASRSWMAVWIASSPCARNTTGTSIILPSTEIEPRPAATASSYAATIFFADATSSGLGANSSFRIGTCAGWI